MVAEKADSGVDGNMSSEFNSVVWLVDTCQKSPIGRIQAITMESS